MLANVEDPRLVEFVSDYPEDERDNPHNPVDQKQQLVSVGARYCVLGLVIEQCYHDNIHKAFIGSEIHPLSISLLLTTHNLSHPLFVVIHLLLSLVKLLYVSIRAKARAPPSGAG